jgi:hypothetical protein
LGAVDAEGGGALGARVDDSSACFNSTSISSAFTCRFGAPCMARSPCARFLSPPRDVLLPPVPSRRWLRIRLRTAPISVRRLSSRSCKICRIEGCPRLVVTASAFIADTLGPVGPVCGGAMSLMGGREPRAALGEGGYAVGNQRRALRASGGFSGNARNPAAQPICSIGLCSEPGLPPSHLKGPIFHRSIPVAANKYLAKPRILRILSADRNQGLTGCPPRDEGP